MRDFIGNIVVKLRNPVVTGEFGGVNVYDYLFIRVKNVYIPFFNLYRYAEFMNYDDSVMKSYYVANLFSKNYREYVKSELWNDVEAVRVDAVDNPLTAIVLKALNIIEKSNIAKKYLRLFDMRLGVSSFDFLSNDREKKVFGFDYAREILHGIIASYLSGKEAILVGDSSTPLFTPLEIDAMRNVDFNRFDKNGNLIVNVKTQWSVPSPVMTYTRYFIPYGRLHFRVVFDRGVYWYNPPFSSKVITGMFNAVPDYSYNFKFISSSNVCSIRGLRKISHPRKIPVLKSRGTNEVVYYTVLGDKFYLVSKIGNEFVVVELDVANIVQRGAKSISYKCPNGKVLPVTGISREQLELLVNYKP